MQVRGFATSFHDPSFQPLVPRLIDLLLESSAANTAQKYSCGWQRWKAWARPKLGVSVLPAIPLQVALYLTELVDRAVHEGHSVSVTESAACSIRCGHRLAGVEPLTGHPLVRGVVEGARRKLATPVQPKQPLSHDVIADITLSLNTTSASLADIRFLFILLVGYAGVFRITEISNLRVKDITILDDFMKISLIKRKNDQYRERHVTVLARCRKPTYPVGITEIVFFVA